MQRFFVSPEMLSSDPVVLTGPLAHQLCRVLRLVPGDHIVLLDDTGWAYEAALELVTAPRVLARVSARTQPQTEARLRLTLFQALLAEQKMDWVLQKGTELGVTRFVPLVTQRSLRAPTGLGRLERWRRIVTEAAEQSGRARLPTIAPPLKMAELATPPDDTLALIGSVSGEAEPMGRVLRDLRTPPREVWLFIGPEGGFAPEETRLARDAGVRLVSFGPRVLRTETAGLAALAAILCALGEWG